MSEQGFNIRANDNGSVVFYNNQPLVARKGLFCKLVGYGFKLEHVDNATLKEVVRIAYLLKDKKDEHRAIAMLEKLGENHCFVVNRGYKYETIALFEKGLGEL